MAFKFGLLLASGILPIRNWQREALLVDTSVEFKGITWVSPL